MSSRITQQRVVVITGASGGIGLSSAQAFAQAGWQVIAASRTPEKITPVENIRAVQLDPNSESDLAALIKLIADDYQGQLDALINNAGYAQSGPVELLTATHWQLQLNTNVISPALLTAALLPALRAAQGCIINVSSVLGRVGYAWQGAYCASKFALEGWSEALMLETQGQGIRVHLVEPGSTQSNFGVHIRDTGPLPPLYAQTGQHFLKLRERLAQSAQPIARVTDTLLRLATQPSHKFRIAIGKDASAAIWLSRFLPVRLYIGMSRLLARKLLGLHT